MYRQGDVLVFKPDVIGETIDQESIALAERDAGRIVLAYGEATGHAHAIHSKEARSYKKKETPSNVWSREDIYLVVDNTSTLSHEEHSAIPIPVGDYKVHRQIEYTPKAIRVVAD